MKIVMDGQPTVIEKSGFGYYIANLAKELNKLGQNVVLIVPEKSSDFSTPKRMIWDQWTFPIKAWAEKGDIIHKPCFSAPILKKGPTVVTIHDLIALIFPKNLSIPSRFYWKQVMPFSFKFVDAIITDSEHSKKDIIKYLKVAPKKITVIPLAAGDNYRPIKDPKEIDRIKKKYGIKKDYIISVSTIEPRKNIPFLIEAFGLALKNNPSLDYQLVLTGKKGWGLETIQKIIEKNNLADRIVFSGYVADEDMAGIYSGASLFAFPSIYEGFGLTPLEAMACAVPVICSNASSLPEVCGDAAILLDPNNLDAWSKNIAKVLLDKKALLEMSKNSIAQSKKFSWRKTAEETLKVYNSL